MPRLHRPLCLAAALLLTSACASKHSKTMSDTADSPHAHHDGDHHDGDHHDGDHHDGDHHDGDHHDGDHHGGDHHGGGHHGDNGHGYKGHRFDDPAAWTEHFESAERTAWQKPDAVVAALHLAADAKIADIGAGTGYFAVRLAAAAPQGKVFAVDIEPAMVAWLGQRAREQGLSNMIAVQGQADTPALPEPVDLVFMCNVFHHITDPTAYFAAVAGSLRPGAKVVIVDFRKDNPDDAPGPPAEMRMTVEEISDHMQAAGYRLANRDESLLQYQVILTFERG